MTFRKKKNTKECYHALESFHAGDAVNFENFLSSYPEELIISYATRSIILKAFRLLKTRPTFSMRWASCNRCARRATVLSQGFCCARGAQPVRNALAQRIPLLHLGIARSYHASKRSTSKEPQKMIVLAQP